MNRALSFKQPADTAVDAGQYPALHHRIRMEITSQLQQ